ncbi:MAG: hypothetical protein R3A48_12610 [Polyangiales bacterium]
MHRSTVVRRTAAALLLSSLVLARGVAGAWTDARPAGLVTEVAVRPDGGAEVTLRIRWRVLAGRLHQFELAELPADLTLIEASASTRADATIPLRANTIAPGRMEVSLGDSNGVRRGTVDVVIRYTTSLRATGAIQRAGPDAVIEVATVPWERGLEAAELRVTVPASARRAQWIGDDTPGVEAQTTTELSRDVVHALRRHLPPSTRWSARIAVDPHAFPWLASRVATGPRPSHLAPATRRSTHLAGLCLASVFLLLGVAVSRRAGPAALPFARAARWIPALLLVVGGLIQPLAVVGVQGALPASVLLVVLAIALRHPTRQQEPLASSRGKARWLEGRAVAALEPRLPWGAVAATALAVVAALAVGAWALRHASLAAGLAAVDLALLGGGIAAMRLRMRPSDFTAMRAVSMEIARAVGPTRRARLAWRLRGAPGSLGSLRARVVPRPGWRLVRGLASVELGCAWRRGAVAWQPRPYAVLRATQDSEGADVLAALSKRLGALTRDDARESVSLAVELVGADADLFVDTLRRELASMIVAAPTSATRSQLGAEDTATLSAPL